MKYALSFAALLASATPALSATVPFELTVSGANFDIARQIEISDLGEGRTETRFQFTDKAGKPYAFELKYKALPDNRSFPGNLDITLKDGAGNKLGYLFFAINGVDFLSRMGTFGLITDVNGEPVDIRFRAASNPASGAPVDDLWMADMDSERFVLDILVPKFDFQMIRPVILPATGPARRSQTYSLDRHPYEVDYTLQGLGAGRMEFQSSLTRREANGVHLMQRVYFQAGSLDTLREAMYASKYFDARDGAFKLVYYPAMGQTAPAGK